MLKISKLSHHQSGDTIVEVLIAIGIVGLMLASAYAITNRSNRSLQDAQERGQALKLVETQIELLRNSGSLPVGSTCFKSDGTAASGTTCKVGADGQPTTTQPAYTLSITSGTVYTVRAAWSSVLGVQTNVTVYYRL